MIKKRESRAILHLDPDIKGMILDQQALRATRTVTTEEDTLTNEIRKAIIKDPLFERIKDNDEKYKKENGILLYQGLIYIPREVRPRILRDNHDAKVAGHFGIEKTMDRIT